ncbi:MAG: metal-dependent hydrolase [Gammaproteobacteria bacterium]|nr:MAG: metal-dependent hydrolase [Gammaproteobacteria bacterium]
MDSLTQIALGAAVGEAVLGRKVGHKAAVWGAVLGTVPDLDVFIPLGDPVADFTYHRSFSHSIIVLTLVSPAFAWLILKFHAQPRSAFGDWWLLSFLVLVTHPLLDVFTVYGTQLLWPLDDTPYFVSSVFIVDPAYTLPLLAGLGITFLLARERERRPWLPNALGLLLSSAYLAWGLYAKFEVESFARAELDRQGISHERLLTVPTPANTLLWRILVMGEETYYEGFRSLLDRSEFLQLHHVAHDPSLLEGIEDHWPVERLRWFTDGFYSVTGRDSAIVITDLRMGHEPNYVFAFRVALSDNPHPKPIPADQLPMNFQLDELGWVWRRIWDEDATRSATDALP